MDSSAGGCWPTPQQELLLKATLLRGQAALRAWQAWKSNVDFDSDYLDQGTRRLFPLLHHNLRNQGAQDPLMPKLKGLYLRTWYENQILFNDMSSLLRAFHDVGIETAILKGAALTLLHYKDYGLRPMADFDVLVPTERAPEAVSLLVKSGWEPVFEAWMAQFERGYLIGHATVFSDDSGQRFDLHWHLLPECVQKSADDDFWEGSVLAVIHGVPTRALNPTDQLLHVCVHGARWNPVPPIRWVADAMTIITTSQDQIDWDRLIRQADKRRLILPLRETLDYLRSTLSAPVPLAALRRLSALPVTNSERIEHRIKAGRVGLLGTLPVTWGNYSRAAGNVDFWRKAIEFSTFLQQIWGLDYVWQIPLYVARRGAHRLRGN